MDMDGLEVRAEQHDDMMKMTMEGDDIDMKVEFGDAYDGTMISTMTKFDDYFMYSMDNIDSTHSMAEQCGPGLEQGRDPCKELVDSGESCCALVVMTDKGSGKQDSFYRCMNQKVMDVSFAVEIDGMSMNMGCSSDTSGAKYLIGSFIASAATLAAVTIF